MFETGTLVVLGLATAAAFGIGGITVARWMTASKPKNKDNE